MPSTIPYGKRALNDLMIFQKN